MDKKWIPYKLSININSYPPFFSLEEEKTPQGFFYFGHWGLFYRPKSASPRNDVVGKCPLGIVIAKGCFVAPWQSAGLHVLSLRASEGGVAISLLGPPRSCMDCSLVPEIAASEQNALLLAMTDGGVGSSQ